MFHTWQFPGRKVFLLDVETEHGFKRGHLVTIYGCLWSKSLVILSIASHLLEPLYVAMLFFKKTCLTVDSFRNRNLANQWRGGW